MATLRPVGSILRDWRQRRHLSQLEPALSADISARHLSFVETGRYQPSREMVLHLAQRLDVPLRQRNELLVAAGYAPAFSERRIDDPALETPDVCARLARGERVDPGDQPPDRFEMSAAGRLVSL